MNGTLKKYRRLLKLKIKRIMSNYPLTTSHFIVEWGGTRTGFTEISGLSIGAESIKYREGNSPTHSLEKLPGQLKYKNIILKRGLKKNDLEFYDWINTIQHDKVERRDITISLLNENHEPVIVWKLKNAFPIHIEWSDLRANANEPAIESIEINHEGINMDSI